MKKVTITVSAKDYTITVDDEFATVLQNDVKRFMNDQDSFDSKGLLTAFVQKCFECYKQEDSISKLSLKIDKITQANQTDK